MAERVIPLVDQRLQALRAAVPARPIAATGLLSDGLGRPLRDLRISVTDRCNFRCSYCMPKEVFDKDYAYLPHSSLLSFEEITRVARQFVAHGVDGMKTDERGNLYTTSGGTPGIVQITSPAGTPLGRLHLPQPAYEPRPRVCATNVAFGDPDGRGLYITACTHLFKLRLKVAGSRRPV